MCVTEQEWGLEALIGPITARSCGTSHLHPSVTLHKAVQGRIFIQPRNLQNTATTVSPPSSYVSRRGHYSLSYPLVIHYLFYISLDSKYGNRFIQKRAGWTRLIAKGRIAR